MRISLIYELQMAKPWHDLSEYNTYWRAIAQIELAEEMGFHGVWCVEHHFLTEYSHSSAPEVFFGAISQRTQRIRLGHGVVLLPHRYNHPVRVAERAAVLHILCNGRVELGTGRSITEQELGGFGIDPDETIGQGEESVRAIPQMWMKDAVSFDGTYLKMPERSVLPKPVQKPHPPLWHAATQPSSFERAGRLGLGLLSFGFLAPGMLEAQLKIYRDAAASCTDPAGAFVNNQVAASAMACCAETRAKAYDVAEKNMRFFLGTGAAALYSQDRQDLPVLFEYHRCADLKPRRKERRVEALDRRADCAERVQYRGRRTERYRDLRQSRRLHQGGPEIPRSGDRRAAASGAGGKDASCGDYGYNQADWPARHPLFPQRRAGRSCAGTISGRGGPLTGYPMKT
jgi:alkanesulfonate monooxygenase SsuD/methylene tetrahydromethanopterin reductase-like flavin-dependent oxidoreductase (luciferase family)